MSRTALFEAVRAFAPRRTFTDTQVPLIDAVADALGLPPADGVQLDGVMLGRAAYHEPAILGQADRRLFGSAAADVDAFAAVDRYRSYMAARLAEGVHLAAMTRHMLGLMHGRPGARAFRRILTVEAVKPGAGLEVVDRAVAAVREAEARTEARTEAA